MSSAAWQPSADFTRDAEPSSPVLLLVGHGSRDPRATAEHESLARAYRTRRSGAKVETAYIELSEPLLEEGLARAASGARRVVVVPLFLFGAGHVKNDVPLALEAARARFPGVAFSAAPPLGVHPDLVALAWERAAPLVPEEE